MKWNSNIINSSSFYIKTYLFPFHFHAVAPHCANAAINLTAIIVIIIIYHWAATLLTSAEHWQAEPHAPDITRRKRDRNVITICIACFFHVDRCGNFVNFCLRIPFRWREMTGALLPYRRWFHPFDPGPPTEPLHRLSRWPDEMTMALKNVTQKEKETIHFTWWIHIIVINKRTNVRIGKQINSLVERSHVSGLHNLKSRFYCSLDLLWNLIILVFVIRTQCETSTSNIRTKWIFTCEKYAFSRYL